MAGKGKRRIASSAKRIAVPPLEAFGGDDLARAFAKALITAAAPEHFTLMQAGQLVVYGGAMAAVQRAAAKLQRKRISAKDYAFWSDVRRKESMVIASLATKLRITASSVLSKDLKPNAAARIAAPPAPTTGALGSNPLLEARKGQGGGFVQ